MRRERGLTQEGLAERSGLSVDLIKKLEQGKRRSARLTSLGALADALAVRLVQLLPVEATAEPAGATPAGVPTIC